MSVTADNDPSVVDKVTDAPPVVILLPLASLSCTVIVVVLMPSAVMVLDAAVIVDVAALAGPGTKLTNSLSVMAAELTVPVTVAIPALVDEVSVAV